MYHRSVGARLSWVRLKRKFDLLVALDARRPPTYLALLEHYYINIYTRTHIYCIWCDSPAIKIHIYMFKDSILLIDSSVLNWIQCSIFAQVLINFCIFFQVAKRREGLLNYMLFLRVTPTLPNTFINVASPIVDVPYHIFFFATFIGLVPAAYVTVKVLFSSLTFLFSLPPGVCIINGGPDS